MSKDGREIKVAFDLALFATGAKRDDELAKAVKENFLESYVIGDCACIGKISDAVHGGYITGTRI